MKFIPVFIIFLLTTIPLFAGEVKGKVTIWERTLSNEDWKLAKDHADTVVFVTGFNEAPQSSQPVFHDQADKSFSLPVLPLTQGQTVTFRNQDPINHNVFSLSKTKKFDLGLFKAPVEKTITFDKPGLVKVFCNIHPQMEATFLILKNNKYFLTKSDGIFQINNIPPGDYKLRVWVAGAKLASKSIKVGASSKETHDFEIQVVRRPQKHLNKFGKPYKKY